MTTPMKAPAPLPIAGSGCSSLLSACSLASSCGAETNRRKVAAAAAAGGTLASRRLIRRRLAAAASRSRRGAELTVWRWRESGGAGRRHISRRGRQRSTELPRGGDGGLRLPVPCGDEIEVRDERLEEPFAGRWFRLHLRQFLRMRAGAEDKGGIAGQHP